MFRWLTVEVSKVDDPIDPFGFDAEAVRLQKLIMKTSAEQSLSSTTEQW
jgi:hypothetical protein